jgi:hypothetical protein
MKIDHVETVRDGVNWNELVPDGIQLRAFDISDVKSSDI